MNTCMHENIEGEIFELALSHIEKICCGKWLNLEPDDRASEASYFFICALRSLHLDSGYFTVDYKTALIPYMDELNRKTPSRYYN